MHSLVQTESSENRLNVYAIRTLFVAVHFVPLLAIWTGATLFDWIVCAVLYITRMFFVTGGYHRYFAHRTFKTSRVGQFVLGFLAQTSAQKGVLWWAAHHRIHHKFSDTTNDPHSRKVYGFWHSHVGWILSPQSGSDHEELVHDLSKFPELRLLNTFHLVPAILLGFAVTVVGGMVNGGGLSHAFTDGWSTLWIGFFLSTVLVYHGTFAINSLMHWYGKPRYKTGDESKNSLILALVSLGEGWHNNHHYYQRATRQGFFWWEVDLTYYGLKVLSWFGLVWDIMEVPDHVKYDPDSLISHA